MSFRVVLVSTSAKLDLKLNHLVIRNENIVKIPISEIAVLIIESTATSATSAVLCELVKNKVKVIFCDEKRNPITQFMQGLEGIENDHAFFIGDKEINPKKDMEIITDFFSLDINQTKNLTKLYNYIKSDLINEEKYQETTGLTMKMLDYINTLISDIDFKLIYEDDIDLVHILKMVNLKFYYEESTLVEKLIDYLKIMNGFFGKKLFVLLNFKSTFSDSEQLELYKFLQYNKIEIFLIESIMPSNKLESEQYRIIDEDLCVIY